MHGAWTLLHRFGMIHGRHRLPARFGAPQSEPVHLGPAQVDTKDVDALGHVDGVQGTACWTALRARHSTPACTLSLDDSANLTLEHGTVLRFGLVKLRLPALEVDRKKATMTDLAPRRTWQSAVACKRL